MDDFHRANLTKLADYLDTKVVQDHFEMSAYQVNPHGDILRFDERIDLHTCGSAGCALGYAPSAGIDVIPSLDGGWGSYSRRVFGLVSDQEAWDWMFDGNWAGFDNTPAGAAWRIRYFLDHGSPPDNWRENMDFYSREEKEESN